MATHLNIERVEALPSTVSPSTIYIVKAITPGRVDLYFTSNTGLVTLRIANITDAPGVISETLATWVPNLSLKANEFATPINLTLTGDVTGTVALNGKDNASMSTVLVNGGGGGGGVDTSVIEFNGVYLDPASTNDREMYEIPLLHPSTVENVPPSGIVVAPKAITTYVGEITASYIVPATNDIRFQTWSVTLIIRAGSGGGGYTDAAVSSINMLARAPTTGSSKWDLFADSVSRSAPSQQEIEWGRLANPDYGVIKFRTEDPASLGANPVKITGKLKLQSFIDLSAILV